MKKILSYVTLLLFVASVAQAQDTMSIYDDDKKIGSNDAPIVLIEFSSLSCPHCATFHKDILPKLTKDYIEQGKLLYVMRDFPSNHAALSGFMLAHCSDDYFDMLNALFDSQEFWAFNRNYIGSLRNIAKLGGIEEDKFEACMGNKALEEQIYEKAYNYAKTLNIYSTPTFLINGHKIEGLPTYYKLKTLIDNLLEASAVNHSH